MGGVDVLTTPGVTMLLWDIKIKPVAKNNNLDYIKFKSAGENY